MIRKILIWPDAQLRKKSKDVEPQDPGLPDLIRDMADTMDHAGGIGLAAIQIGVPKRVFVLRLHPAGDLKVYVNPAISVRGPDTEAMSEGCLSLPGIYENVRRHTAVTLLYQDLDLSHQRAVAAVGLHAQAIQHELEHLDGRMFVDRKDPGAKDRLRAQLRRQRGGF